MEISSTLPVTIDIIEENFERNERKSVCNYCCQYLFDFGIFFICLMSFCVFIGLPLIEITIGIIYRNECSMNYFIPIYLIIAGLISSILLVFGIFARIFVLPWIKNFKLKNIKTMIINDGIICQIMFGLAMCFIIFGCIWFILGNIWVFSKKSIVQYTNQIESPMTYCHRIVYLTSFASIIIKYVFIWMIIWAINCHVCFDIEKLLTKHNRN